MAAVTPRRVQRQLNDERAASDGERAPQLAPERVPAFLRGGNAAAVALLARVQPKLRVGPAGDRYEQEADDIAAEVMRALSTRDAEQEGTERQDDEEGSVHGALEEEGAEHEGEESVQRSVGGPRLARRVQRKASPSVGAGGGDLDGETEAAIQRARGGGSRLAAPVQRQMEGAFGADFSGVRIHTGAEPTRLNDTIQAKAFTLGNDVFFRGSAPDTSTAGGQQLLAHELTHTLQQGNGSVALQRWSLFGKKDDKPKKEKKESRTDQAKKSEKVEKERLKAEKEVGTKQREMMTESYGGNGEALGKLKGQFDAALEKEAALKAQLIKSGKSPEDAENEAYKKIWLDAPAGLRALRPMRETRAEKLVSKTAETRGEIAAHETSKKGVKELRGALLSKKLEDLFVKEVQLVNDMLGLKVPVDEAKQEAYEMVWLKADPELLAKRPPRGSKLEAAAYEHAEKRARRPAVEKSGTDVVGKLGLVDSIGGGVTKVTGGVGKATNFFSDDGNKKTLSTGEQAGGGIDGISQMISGVLSTVSGIAEFVDMVSDLIKQDSVDYNDICNAISAGLTELKKLDNNVMYGMKTASALNESALASLAGVIPIVSVISNSIAVAANTAELFASGTRWAANLSSVYAARIFKKPEMVLLQQRLGQRADQQLEQAVFTTVASLTKLSADIAQLASGGMDMGATTAIKTAVIVIEGAHSLAHMIADTVFAVQAKNARKDYFGAHSEGSAEALLRKDAGFAVDGLLTAATKGDADMQYLAKESLKDGYGVVLKTGSTAELVEARERIFKLLGESSDPKTALDKLKDGVKGLTDKTTAWSDQSANVKTLAEARNKADGKNRGFGWRMKMWFKSDGAIQRRIAQANVDRAQGDKLQTAAEKRMAKFGSKGPDPFITQPQVQQAIIDKMAGMDSKALLAASKDMSYTQFERIVLSQAAAEKLKEELAASTSGSSSASASGSKSK